MWIRKSEYEDMIMHYNRKVKESREEARKSDEQAALIHSAALKTLSSYGPEATDRFFEIMATVKKIR